MKPLRSPAKIFFLFAVLITGVIFFFPNLNFQGMLSQGDHGRDLYCFRQTMDGAVPYRDYWWVYGPLMPYYYSVFFKFFGVSIQSILLGKIVLQILCGILFFLAAAVFIELPLAFIATLWFWTFNPDFFFTYNHISGIAAYLAIIYCFFLYLNKPLTRYIYLGFLAIFILALIKVNIGISSLLGFTLSLLIADFLRKDFKPYKRNLYFRLTSITLLAIAAIYGILLQGLPLYYIRQCFPYLKADHQYYSSIGNALGLYLNFMKSTIASNTMNLAFAGIIIFSTIQTFFIIVKKNCEEKLRISLLALFASFVVLSILNLHEFLNSAVLYRSFWIAPFKFLIIFIVISFGMRRLSPLTRAILWGILLFIIFTVNLTNVRVMQSLKDPAHYLSLKTAKIYVTNSSQWLDTVNQTTQYLMKNLSEDETFFALPYDPLYYFLTEKVSPTRQLIFFDHINIQPQQEQEIIQQLNVQGVNYILLSSRCCNARETGLGTFGVSYCQLLAKYIHDHFEVVAAFGDWQNTPGWAWNHGTRIFKRVR